MNDGYDEKTDTDNASRGTRILMVAGGTGGHIFPALAVAEELRGRGEPGVPPYEIEFLGTHRPLEAKLIPAAGFRLRTVDAAGLKGIGGIHRLRNLLVLPRTAIEVAVILREFRPDVVVGVGGYLAGPVMLEAALVGIPTVLIEPNAQPGFTNRLLAPVVRAAALGFAESSRVYGTKAHVTGLPVRRAFFEIPPRRPVAQALLPVPGGTQPGVAVSQPHFTVLVVGGSQGSRAINQAVSKALPPLAQEMGGIRVIHQTGEHDYNEVLKVYQEHGLVAEVHAFIDDMPGVLAQADLVISRAGANAVTELAAAGRAALLIPFPGATDQHQLENAQAMKNAGAARVIVQSTLTPEGLAKEIRELMASPATLTRMESSARGLARPDAAARIADLIENFLREE
ncbi:MAG TPA: undecaprenyldiphospho-muramoylpentapeptide beta-N-acetylglucosaminyltransferase [Terriglobia bacterium]|nr:undecaprenyldiphospho-muramoylpentapeptide beta-N-acetylglucosaminyltransferase [Terriglobia bacterium]